MKLGTGGGGGLPNFMGCAIFRDTGVMGSGHVMNIDSV